MGQVLVNFSSLYTATICCTFAAMALGADYHVYLSKKSSSKTITCSSATSQDSCTIHCDKQQAAGEDHSNYIFDCGNTANCAFNCESYYCANSATVKATNVAQNFTLTSTSKYCMSSTKVLLPNEGSALLSNEGDTFRQTAINSGTNTKSIRVDCNTNCDAPVINGQKAQHLTVNVAKGMMLYGERAFLRYTPAVINCPHVSDGCVVDLSAGASMQYTTINTLHGIPQDLVIIPGTDLIDVTVSCKSYSKSSAITGGKSSAISVNKAIDGAACSVPLSTTTLMPTIAITTPKPTFILTTTTAITASVESLRCNEEKQGTFTGTKYFIVAMKQSGELIFTAKTDARLIALQAEEGTNVIATDANHDGVLMLNVKSGYYKFMLDVGADTSTAYDVSVACETISTTVAQETKKPTLRPTAAARDTVEPTRDTATERTTMRVTAAKPTRRWLRTSSTTRRENVPSFTTTKQTDILQSKVVEPTYYEGNDTMIEGQVVIPPQDTFKDVFISNLGYFVLALIAFGLCVFALFVMVKRARKRRSEEWVALV